MRMSALAARLDRAAVVLASLAALVSALVGAWIGVPRLEDWREEFGSLPPSLRDDPIGLFLGFDVATWDTLRASLRKGDRYAVVAEGERRFEVRNYAAFALLPAIQVVEPANANVVLYYETSPPTGSRCKAVGKEVCLVRSDAT